MRPIIIYGPTALGKSNLAIEIAKLRPSTIISMDSVMHYRGFDIGSAKPSLEERQRFPHHLIDHISLPEVYTVADFVNDVKRIISAETMKQRQPIIVGGTLLYLNALLYGHNQDAPEVNLTTHQSILETIKNQTQEERYNELMRIDPDWAEKINKNDSQRTIRGLMVYHVHQKTLSSYHRSQKNECNTNEYTLVALTTSDRQYLRDKVKIRIDNMFNAGLEEEFETLRCQYSEFLSHPAFKSIGYKQFVESDATDSIPVQEKIFFATSQFAKRQFTWMKKFTPNITIELDKNNEKKIRQNAYSILEYNS
ncbi:MAG: tRNA (adenosine(37)-N6)-dimethylallyltransferase MiaA [Legionellales bacterium]|nr:tRNA (adenosine(37)-N6)-dimethylallyltransferase MiaA [Legionellales bacterium]